MKFLVLRFSSIGDIILTTPVLRGLKQQLPGAEVHFVTKKEYAWVLEANPYIDRHWVLGNSLTALTELLREEHFDAVIDLHNNLRTRGITARLGGVPVHRFNKLNWRKLLYTSLKINTMPSVHIVDRYLETVADFGVKDDGGGLDYFIPEKDRLPGDFLPRPYRGDFMAFAIGGQHCTKKLPPERMIELCRRVQLPLVLLGGPEDAPVAEAVVAALPGRKVMNLCGQVNFHQSAWLVRQAARVLTHDTGLMHAAAAFRRPIVSIWGNTVPEFGMYPYRTPYEAWQVGGLPCRPCSKIGYDRCPKEHFRCMNEQTFPAQVTAEPTSAEAYKENRVEVQS